MLAAEDILSAVSLRRFYEYWDGLPKRGFVPDRADFNPAAIHKLMPSVTMLEVTAPDFILVRLAGTAIVVTVGVDMTGHNYLDYFTPEDRTTYLSILGTQLAWPCGRRSVIHARKATGVLGRIEVLSLPMYYARTGNPIMLNCFEAMKSTGIDDGSLPEVEGVEDIQWIDIGAGVPPKR